MENLERHHQLYNEFIQQIHVEKAWIPHAGQIRVGQALFEDDIRDIFLECGRNWGKSELAAYTLTRWAWLNPGSENYYFFPLQVQGREIIWENKRLQNFIPLHWISSINETEMRVTLINGSFIKVDGTDNIDKYRGVKPKGLSIIEEYKDCRPAFYDVYDPNRAPYNAPLIIVGTPPEVPEHHFIVKADEFKADPKKLYLNAPTRENPIITEEWLAKKKKEYYDKGEGEVYEREYEARRVFGGKSSVFPMIHGYEVTPHRVIEQEIARDLKKLEWYCIADPGTVTCFAVLFVAINPYTKKQYLLDEIYETDQAKTSVSQIGQRIVDKCAQLGKGKVEWNYAADEAAAWFIQEMSERFDIYFAPTNKAANKKEAGLSLIKDILLRKLAVISDRCVKLMWEMQNCIKDKNGKVKKENDHLIDDWRYLNSTAGYLLENENEPADKEHDEMFRGARMEDDFPELKDFDGEFD